VIWVIQHSFRFGELMEIRPGLLRTEALDVAETRCLADQLGYTTFVLPTNGIVDRASFFDAVRATLPLDPPLVGSRSWDAMSDSLWEGLYDHGAQRIAILWPNAETMGSRAPSDFETALGMLADLATSLADTSATRGKPKELAVIVAMGDRDSGPVLGDRTRP
jgi:hypothetical protein